MKKHVGKLVIISIVFLIIPVISMIAVDEEIHGYVANFRIIGYESVIQNGMNIVYEKPICLFENKYGSISLTKLTKVSDGLVEYVKPVLENGKPVLVEPGDSAYDESIKYLCSDYVYSNFESEGKIDTIILSFKDFNEDNNTYYVRSKAYKRTLDNNLRRLAYINYMDCVLASDHLLNRYALGSIMITDSNYNYNTYDAQIKYFNLSDTGCLSPDQTYIKNCFNNIPELILLTQYSYWSSEFKFGRGHIELFEGKEVSIINGVEKETGHILRPDSEIPTVYIQELVAMLGCRMENVLNNDYIRIYKLNNLPDEDDFYRILEFSLGSDQAKIITNSGEQEITLSFAPKYDQGGPRHGIIFPLFDFLDAMEITYHHPRANKGILIANFQEYGMYDLP